MAKLVDRTELTTPADGDWYVTTDVSDTTDAITGTDKKITWANIKAGLLTYFQSLFVTKVGTPMNNQIGVWTGDGTIEGDAALTFDTTTDTLTVGTSQGLLYAGGSLYVSAGGDGLDAEFHASSGTTSGSTGGSVYIQAGSNNGTAVAGNTYINAGNAQVGSGQSGGNVYIQGGLEASGGTEGIIQMFSPSAGTTGVVFELYQSSSSPAVSDITSSVRFYGRDSATNKQLYNKIDSRIISPTSTTESADLVFYGTTGGVNTVSAYLHPTYLTTGANDQASLGTGTVSWSDLFLASGGVINFNNGNATLTHSAGLLTSNVPVSLGTTNALTAGSIEIGHASDTTLTRVSAGVAAIEGKNIALNGTGETLTTGTIELGAASDTTLSRSSAGVLAVEGVVIPSISSTNTLTNKRISPRTGTTTSSATPTINTDNVDFYSLTAQAVDITSFTTNLSGTPTEGQKLWIAITGTAARAITWGASFEASTVALPTTTVTTNRLDVGFVWNTVTSKWRCVATS